MELDFRPSLGAAWALLPRHRLPWDSAFLPVLRACHACLDHLPGGQRLPSGAGGWSRACESPLPTGGQLLEVRARAELSWEGLFVLVDISEGCWASLVLWLSRHSRLPPGTKFRVPRILAGPRPGFGKSPFCSSCCRWPRLSHSQMTVLPGVHSLSPAWIDPADVISSRPAGLASSRRPGARGSPPHRGPLTEALGFALALGEQMAPSPFSSEPCKNKKLKDPQV